MEKFGIFRGMHDRIHLLALSQDWDTFVRFEAGNDVIMLKESLSLNEFLLAMNHQLHLYNKLPCPCEIDLILLRSRSTSVLQLRLQLCQ